MALMEFYNFHSYYHVFKMRDILIQPSPHFWETVMRE